VLETSTKTVNNWFGGVPVGNGEQKYEQIVERASEHRQHRDG